MAIYKIKERTALLEKNFRNGRKAPSYIRFINIVPDIFKKSGHGARLKIYFTSGDEAVYPFSLPDCKLNMKKIGNNLELLNEYNGLKNYIIGLLGYAKDELNNYCKKEHSNEDCDLLQQKIYDYDNLSDAERRKYRI